MFEKEFLKVMAEIAIQPRVDQYGNTQESLLIQSVQRFIKANESIIYEKLSSKLNETIIVEVMANRVVEIINGRWGNSWDRENHSNKINARVMEIIAQKFAEDKIKEMSN